MRRVVVLAMMVLLAGCGSVVSSPTPQDTALRSVAAVKLSLTAAYTMTEDLILAGRLDIGQARDIYGNLERAQRALATAEALVAKDPASAQVYIATVLQIATDILADLNQRKLAPPSAVSVFPRIHIDSSAGGAA
jgi:hypothetical protein